MYNLQTQAYYLIILYNFLLMTSSFKNDCIRINKSDISFWWYPKVVHTNLVWNLYDLMLIKDYVQTQYVILWSLYSYVSSEIRASKNLLRSSFFISITANPNRQKIKIDLTFKLDSLLLSLTPHIDLNIHLQPYVAIFIDSWKCTFGNI